MLVNCLFASQIDLLTTRDLARAWLMLLGVNFFSDECKSKSTGTEDANSASKRKTSSMLLRQTGVGPSLVLLACQSKRLSLVCKSSDELDVSVRARQSHPHKTTLLTRLC